MCEIISVQGVTKVYGRQQVLKMFFFPASKEEFTDWLGGTAPAKPCCSNAYVALCNLPAEKSRYGGSGLARM